SGAAALGGTGALLAGTTSAAQNQGPAVLTGTQIGRTFRGLVRHDTTLDVQELRLLPIDPRQVVIRSQAVAPCYTIVRGALGTSPIRRAEVPNHCGFGVVEAAGPMVKRVQVGDRVVVAGTSQCGQCYQCLQGSPDYCQFTFFANAPGVEAFPPFAEIRDGTRVHAQAGIVGTIWMLTPFVRFCVHGDRDATAWWNACASCAAAPTIAASQAAAAGDAPATRLWRAAPTSSSRPRGSRRFRRRSKRSPIQPT